jgi:leucyl-tRNA synthetase
MKQLIKTGFIPYNSKLKAFARKNRRSQTEAEGLLWETVLRAKKLDGYKFTRQKPIHSYILDFYCSKLSLGIEVDGGSHIEKEEYDQRRTFLLNGFGIDIIRFSNEEVIQNINSIRKQLSTYIESQNSNNNIPLEKRCPLSLIREKGQGG